MGRARCCVAMDQYWYHGLFSAMRQHELPQNQQIHLPPTCCMSLLESERSEDPSHSEISGLSKYNPLTVVVLVMKCSSSSLYEPFANRIEWGSQSCWDVRTIQGKSSNFCCVVDELLAQTIVPDIYSGTVTSSWGRLMPIFLCMQGLSCTLMCWWRIWFGFTMVWSNLSPIYKASLNTRIIFCRSVDKSRMLLQ